jgi:hypothetical protein
MASRRPLTDSEGEVRELTAKDLAVAVPFSALPEAEREMLSSLRSGGRQKSRRDACPNPTLGAVVRSSHT